jgi:hypothetical protein
MNEVEKRRVLREISPFAAGSSPVLAPLKIG